MHNLENKYEKNIQNYKSSIFFVGLIIKKYIKQWNKLKKILDEVVELRDFRDTCCNAFLNNLNDFSCFPLKLAPK